MLTDKKISVVPICYKDEGSVREMYKQVTEAMKEITDNYEIIYVNDCSPDDSMEIFKELAEKDPKLTVITHSRNFNSQMAFTSGLRYCTGDAAIILDGDLQDPPALFPDMVKKWLEGNDVVYGVRTSREEGWLIHFCRKVFYRIFQKLSYIRVPVDVGDFSLMDRRVIEVLNHMPERDRFFRGLRAWVGFKQTGVPYHRLDRFDGRRAPSSLRGYIWYAKNGILSFSRAPLEFITYLGFFFTLIAFIAIAIYLAVWLIVPPEYSPPGIITIIILILFFGGVQLLSISIVGEYISKIFDEVKQRPPYIIDNILNDYRGWMDEKE